MIALNLAYLITGVVVVEVVFVYPGVGQLFVDSVKIRDIPVCRPAAQLCGGLHLAEPDCRRDVDLVEPASATAEIDDQTPTLSSYWSAIVVAGALALYFGGRQIGGETVARLRDMTATGAFGYSLLVVSVYQGQAQ